MAYVANGRHSRPDRPMRMSAQVGDLAGPGSAIPTARDDRTRDRPWHGPRFHIDRAMIDGLVVRDLERHEPSDMGRR